MRICYVICPLGPERSSIRKRSNKLLELVIKPVASPLSYKVFRADLTQDQWRRTIPDSISEHIFKDELVIADLTDWNPNVFYELGKRHAWGGNTVHLTNNISNLPFDISHHPVLQYDLSDAQKIEKLRQDLRLAIESMRKVPPQCPFPLTPDDVIRLAGSTVLVQRVLGRRDHYYLAKNLAQKQSTRMFLMQRSSSLILGPEQGWGAEEVFYNTLLTHLERGTEFLHVASLEGIARHLDRPGSTFPNIRNALDFLADDRGLVAVRSQKHLWHIKKMTEKDTDMKPDRQARILIVELKDGATEGVIVFDLGDTQCCLHLRGPDMRNFMHDCVDFYVSCDYLKWDELREVIGKYVNF